MFLLIQMDSEFIKQKLFMQIMLYKISHKIYHFLQDLRNIHSI